MKSFFTSLVIMTFLVLCISLMTEKSLTSYAESISVIDNCDSQQWDKIVFNITHPKLAQYLNLPLNSELDIKVLDDPTQVLDLKKTVLEFLNVPTKTAYYNLIDIVEVEHATICISKETTLDTINKSVFLNIIGFGGKTATESIQHMDIVFAIDSSTSMNENDPDNLRLQSASSFVESLNPSNDRAGVLSWDQGIDFTLGLTSDMEQVLSNINSVDSGGSTDLGVGLQEAVRILDDSARTDSSKIIVFLSDGNTEVDDSPVNIDNVIAEAASKNYTIYSIGLSYEAGEIDLRKMATETGGKFYSTPSAADLQEIFGNIYTTIIESTSPTNVDLILTPNGGDHSISIEENSFNIEPTNVYRTDTGQTVMQWYNVSQYIGNEDNALDAGETFTLSFEVEGLLNEDLSNTITNSPSTPTIAATTGSKSFSPPHFSAVSNNISIFGGEESEVRYILPNGNPENIKVPEIFLDPASDIVVEDIVLEP